MHRDDLDCGMVDACDANCACDADNACNVCDACNAVRKNRATREDINDAVGLSPTADSACGEDVSCAENVGSSQVSCVKDVCKHIGDLAVKALLYELSTTPKPGLVDRDNNGAHTDMNYQMFRASANALRECFEDCARAGMESSACVSTRAADDFGEGCRNLSKKAEGESQIDDVRVLFESSKELLEFRLRRIGLAGERKMFRVTGGVNTHKGLIFSLGIICAACGVMVGEGESLIGDDEDVSLSKYVESKSQIDDIKFDAKELQQKCIEISRKVLEVGRTTENTHGNIVYAKTGIYGAKGEALSGFSTAFNVGLPVLRNALNADFSGNDAMVVTLLYIMTVTDDSNIVYRGGLDGLQFVKEKSRLLIDCDFDIESVQSFDRECIERNLSPGGSADLLAVTAMLHMIVKADDEVR